jgi:hypothetical protein
VLYSIDRPHLLFIGLSSILVANTALMIGLGYLFDILKKDRQEETRFMVGLWFAVASLIFTRTWSGHLRLDFDEHSEDPEVKDIFQYLTGLSARCDQLAGPDYQSFDPYPPFCKLSTLRHPVNRLL